jgi:hypothetical protein
MIPIFPFTVAARVVEVVLRGSLFRSSYEMLYGPVPASDKRAVKTMIDVGCDRMGDAAGAGTVQFMIMAGPSLLRTELMLFAMGLSAVSTFIALRIGSTYRTVLEQGLIRKMNSEPVVSEETMALGDSLLGTVFRPLPLARAALPEVHQEPAPKVVHVARAEAGDQVVRTMVELRSGDEARVVAALSGPWQQPFTAQAIELLAWDSVSPAARAYLERGIEKTVGQIVDALLDSDVEFAIRRRIPRILARCGSQRAVDGLIDGLRDARFEVRFQCGRALDYLRQHHPQLEFPSAEVYAALTRELSVSKSIWRSRRILDKREGSEEYSYLDSLIKDRANQNLEHVFSLLALVLPREPLMAAFRGLHEEDRAFRSLALEYLETVLPRDLRDRLWVILDEEDRAPARTVDPEEERALLESLLRSNVQLELKRGAKTTT